MIECDEIHHIHQRVAGEQLRLSEELGPLIGVGGFSAFSDLIIFPQPSIIQTANSPATTTLGLRSLALIHPHIHYSDYCSISTTFSHHPASAIADYDSPVAGTHWPRQHLRSGHSQEFRRLNIRFPLYLYILYSYRQIVSSYFLDAKSLGYTVSPKSTIK